MPKKYTALKSARSFLNEGRSVKGDNKKLIKTGITFLVILLILSICGLVYYSFTLKSISPSSSLSSEAKDRLLIEREGLKSTLVVLSDNDNVKIVGAWYVVFNEKNSATVVYFVPPGVFLKEYLSGVSDYVSVGDLKYIGETVSSTRKLEYAIWQLGNLTGITPDAYLWFDTNSLSAFSKAFGDVSEFKKDRYIDRYSDEDDVTSPALMINALTDKYNFVKLASNFEQYEKFVTGIDTNLTLLELLSRMNILKASLSSDSIDMLDLGQIWATQSVKSESGRDINLVNYNVVDQKLSEFVKDLKGRDIEREQVKIEVYNASEIDGLASRYSRKFENSGIDVVRYENAPAPIDQTTIYVPKKDKFEQSLQLVKKLVVVDAKESEGRPEFMTTGDIIVILGKDMSSEAAWK